MDMKRQIIMYPFMSVIFILIEIKFDIDINNDELLIMIQEHSKKEKSSLVVRSNAEPKLGYQMHYYPR